MFKRVDDVPFFRPMDRGLAQRRPRFRGETLEQGFHTRHEPRNHREWGGDGRCEQACARWDGAKGREIGDNRPHAVQLIGLAALGFVVEKRDRAGMIGHVLLDGRLYETPGNRGIDRVPTVAHDFKHGIGDDGMLACCDCRSSSDDLFKTDAGDKRLVHALFFPSSNADDGA